MPKKTGDQTPPSGLDEAGLEEQTVSTTLEARPVPLLCGEAKIAATWIVRGRVEYVDEVVTPSPKRSKTGDSGVTVYFGRALGAICIGPVEELLAVIFNGKEVWPWADPWADAAVIVAGNLRGHGGRTWEALLSHTADETNAPPSATYWREYSLRRSDWYYPPAWPWSRHRLYGPGYTVTAVDGRTYICIAPDIEYHPEPPDAAHWEELRLPGDSPSSTVTLENYGYLRIYWGTQTEPDIYINRIANYGAEQYEAGSRTGVDAHPAYCGICYISYSGQLGETAAATLPNIELYVRRRPQQSVVGESYTALTDGQANPAAAAAEVLTSDLCVGLAPYWLNIDSFVAVAARLHTQTNLVALSMLIDSQTSVREVFERLYAHTDAWLRYDQTAGQIEAGWFTHGELPASSTLLTVDDLTERPGITSQSWNAGSTAAIIRFKDRRRLFKETTEMVADMRARRIIGEPRELNLDRSWIVRRGQALKHATEALRVQGRPQLDATLNVRREKGKSIRPGDWVLADIDIEPGGANLYQYFRVISREVPRIGSILMRLDADETLTPLPYAPDPAADPPEDTVPVAFSNYRVIPSPHGVSKWQGDILVLAERPDPTITRGIVWVSDAEDGDYAPVGEFNTFAAQGLLSIDIAEADTIIPVTFDNQVDVSLLSADLGELRALHDEMLLILVQTTAAYKIDTRPSGWPWVEVCSVKTIAITGASAYNLVVKRGRLHSRPFAFDSTWTEAWLVRRAGLRPLWHNYFKLQQAD